MHQFAAAQELLVHGAVTAAVAGLFCIVMGAMVDIVSTTFGARLRRLGAQSIGVSLFVLVSHLALISVFGSAPPLLVLVLIYGVVALMLLQASLNLLFGPGVGSRVIADLLSALISGAVYLVTSPIAAFRGWIKRP